MQDQSTFCAAFQVLHFHPRHFVLPFQSCIFCSFIIFLILQIQVLQFQLIRSDIVFRYCFHFDFGVTCRRPYVAYHNLGPSAIDGSLSCLAQ